MTSINHWSVMNTRFRLIQADDGAVQYLGFAKEKARQLIQAGVTNITKQWNVDVATVQIQLFDDGRQCRVWLAALQGGFIVYPSAIKLTAPFNEFAFYSRQERMPVANTEIVPYPKYNSVNHHYRRNGDTTLTAATLYPSDSSGYFQRAAFKSVAKPVLDDRSVVFSHSYQGADGKPAKKLLTTRVNWPELQVYEIGESEPLSTAGAIYGLQNVYDISPDGRTVVGGLFGIGGGAHLAKKILARIDYAATPRVHKEVETLDNFGTERINYTSTTDVEIVYRVIFYGIGVYVNWGNGTATVNKTRTVSAEYPLCFGFSSTNEVQQITLQKEVSAHGECVGHLISLESSNNYNMDGTLSVTRYDAAKLTLPNGVSRSFVTKQYAYSAAGTFHMAKERGPDSGDRVVPGTDSGSGTASVDGPHVEVTLEILYTDASLPAVVYRYRKRTYDIVLSVAYENSTVSIHDATATMTVDERVVLLICEEEHEIYSSTETGVANDFDYDLAEEGDGIPSVRFGHLAGGWGDYLGGNNSFDYSVGIEAYNLPELKCDPKTQSSPLSIAIKDKDHFLGQYTRLSADGTTVLGTVIFGTGNPRQAVVNRLTAQLAAKASAAPPTITGDEQELLDNLRAGTLDGYGIRIERHEEPFGISLT